MPEYTATQLNEMGMGAANNASDGEIINGYRVRNAGNGNRILEPVSGGNGADSFAQSILRTTQIKPEDVALLRALDPSKLNVKDYEAAALAELTPYYERLLSESNWDMDKAKERLIEDYRTGVRQKAEDLSVTLKKLLGTDLPMEQKQQLEDLNKRGMLGTVLNQAAPQRQETVNATYETGTVSSPYTAGKPITTTYTPSQQTETIGTAIQPRVTTAQFGGLAGRQMGELTANQDARVEAEKRAFQRQNESANLTQRRNITDWSTSKVRGQRDMEQEKAEKVPILAGEKYTRAVNENTLKRNTILEPYQLEQGGLTGMLKY